MTEKELKKIGYYTIYEIKNDIKYTYRIDSGKTLFLARYHKFIINPYRDIKEFDTLDSAEVYIKKKLSKKIKTKKKKINKRPKSLYLILMKESSSGNLFIKVGITSKKHIIDRFSKVYGYEGYTVDTILRRIESSESPKLEEKIKDALNKKRSIKKYRPLLESFSGYSECYDYLSIEEIIRIFDLIVNN